jgi:hypothetical protein
MRSPLDSQGKKKEPFSGGVAAKYFIASIQLMSQKDAAGQHLASNALFAIR